MLKKFIGKVVNGKDLLEKEMEEAMGIIMNGSATPTQTGAFITALRMKGETVEEITGCRQDHEGEGGKHQPEQPSRKHGSR